MNPDAIVAAEVSLPGVPGGTARVRARLPDAALAARVRAVLGGLAAAASGAEATAIAVTPEGTGWRLRSPRVAPQYVDTAEDLVARLEWMIVEELLAGLTGVVRLHAAAARVGAHAVLVTGPSGSGKSACARAWSRQGLPLYGDDIVLIDPHGMVHAFPRLGKLDTALARAWQEPLARTVDWDPARGEVWLDPAREGGWAAPAPAATVAWIERRAGAACTTTPLARSALLPELLGQALGGPATDAFAGLTALLRPARTLHVTFGEARDAAAHLAGLDAA